MRPSAAHSERGSSRAISTIPFASDVSTCEADSSTTRSPGSQKVSIATRFAIPHVGTQSRRRLSEQRRDPFAQRVHGGVLAERSPSRAPPPASPPTSRPSGPSRDRSGGRSSSAQVPSRARAGVLAVVDDDRPVDEHVLDAPRVVVRVVDRRDLVERRRSRTRRRRRRSRRGAVPGPRGRSARPACSSSCGSPPRGEACRSRARDG